MVPLAIEFPHTPHQLRSVLAGLANQPQIPPHLFLVIQISWIPEQDAAETDDRGERVGEVVGDPARHFAQRPQPLLSDHLLLGELQMGQLALETEDSLRDPDAGVELVRVEWLRDEIVDAGTHRLEIVLLSAERGE